MQMSFIELKSIESAFIFVNNNNKSSKTNQYNKKQKKRDEYLQNE
jgi:hypothetical protein